MIGYAIRNHPPHFLFPTHFLFLRLPDGGEKKNKNKITKMRMWRSVFPACRASHKLSNIGSMKLLSFSLIAALVCSGCASSPQEKAAERQRELQKEAQERFEEQKEKDKERAEEIQDARERAADDARKRTEDVADARRRAADDAARYRAYEAEYARQLGKKPSQLTSEERQWVLDHF